MNIRNTIENLVIAIVAALMVYFIAVRPLEKQLIQQNKLIKELSEQEKYKIENTFEKVKTDKSGKVNLQINSELNNNSNNDTLKVKKEKKRKKFLGIF